MKNKITLSKTSNDLGYVFDCPGCGSIHRVRTDGPEPCWDFNNSLESPTFSPSLLVREYLGAEVKFICHSFIRDGQIQFLSDCTHKLAGQTVPLLDVEEEPHD